MVVLVVVVVVTLVVLVLVVVLVDVVVVPQMIINVKTKAQNLTFKVFNNLISTYKYSL